MVFGLRRQRGTSICLLAAKQIKYPGVVKLTNQTTFGLDYCRRKPITKGKRMRTASVSIKKGEITYREDLTRHAIVSPMEFGRCSTL
jgi:hypothetical protein